MKTQTINRLEQILANLQSIDSRPLTGVDTITLGRTERMLAEMIEQHRKTPCGDISPGGSATCQKAKGHKHNPFDHEFREGSFIMSWSKPRG